MLSSNSNLKFIDAVLEGEAFDTEIDDYVERWHASDSDSTLADFLGMSEEEYRMWVEQPECLRLILLSKKKLIDLNEILDWNQAHQIAARSQSQGDTKILMEWLEKTGRLD